MEKKPILKNKNHLNLHRVFPRASPTPPEAACPPLTAKNITNTSDKLLFSVNNEISSFLKIRLTQGSISVHFIHTPPCLHNDMIDITHT